MIRNFLTVAIRNFLRQKFYSFINVFGLASGLVCTLFIYLWVNDELSKDKFHRNSEEIFQIVSNLKMNSGEVLTWPITPGPLGEEIRENSPEVAMAVRTQGAGSVLFQHDEKSFMERGFYADPDFFKLFSFKILKGKPNTNAGDISSISISEKLAKKLFGDQNPVGKTVKVNNQTDYTVAAVFEDVPSQSSLLFEFILPFEVYKKNRGDGFNWGNYDHPLYVRLHDPAKADDAIRNINQRRAKVADSDGGSNVQFYMQPFTEYYLNSLYENGQPVGGRIKYVRIFSVVAIFILAIACINFMNMATAKAANRSKEVGIRKVVGAQRRSLVFQFISESTLLSFVSMVLALGIVYLALPLFNSLVAKQISIELSDPKFLLTVIAIILITGLLAGSYPAFFLSSYQPAAVLKGGTTKNFSGAGLRKTLVVCQFALTVILIASSLVVYNQIEFIRNKNIGYDRQSVLSFGLRGELRNQFDSFKDEVLKFDGITHVAKGDQSLVEVQNQNSSVNWPGKPDDSQQFFRTVVVDYGYLETMGLTLQEGRFFKKEFNDTSNFVITERAVEVMGLTDPIGQEITQWGIKGKVVGVVNDFHSRSLHESIDPIIFMCNAQWGSWAFVRFKGTEVKEAVNHIEQIHKKYNPQYPFVYSFVEDDFEKLYNNEKVTGSLALGFTIMAIIISGLGLLGLAAYSAEKRKKEISIRKTLGATVSGIVSMMSKDFVQLSLIAAVFGCPVAYFLMDQFLESYAYHTDLGWEVFVLTALGVMTLTIITVIFQVTKAAIANPVDALRNE